MQTTQNTRFNPLETFQQNESSRFDFPLSVQPQMNAEVSKLVLKCRLASPFFPLLFFDALIKAHLISLEFNTLNERDRDFR